MTHTHISSRVALRNASGQKIVSSTHNILFKWQFYLQRNDPYGKLVLAIALFILVGQFVVLFGMYDENVTTCGALTGPVALWYGATLCAAYAAGVATNNLVSHMPKYDLHTAGRRATAPAARELKERVVKEGKDGGGEDGGEGEEGAEEGGKGGDAKAEGEAEAEAGQQGILAAFPDAPAVKESKYGYRIHLFGIFLIQLQGVGLLVGTAMIMGTSSTLTDLIANFIAMQVVVHADTLIAQALAVPDRGPHVFRHSYIDDSRFYRHSHVLFFVCFAISGVTFSAKYLECGEIGNVNGSGHAGNSTAV